MVRFRTKTQFRYLSEKQSIPSLTKNGKEIWEMLFERSREKGAFFTEILGLMGSGKTSLMFAMIDKSIKENPNELNFLREPEGSPAQFFKLESPFEVFSDARHPIQIYEIREGEPLLPVDDITIRYFHGVKELVKKANPQQINVVYFKPDELYKWCHLIDELKLDSGWQQIWIDEGEDVFPLNSKGLYYEANTMFAASAKQVRKSRVGLTYNTQNSHDCDWRLRYKIMLWFYLRGSRVDPLSPVYQGAVGNLSTGQAYVDFMRGRFGVIRFKPYLPKPKEYVVLPVVTEDKHDDSS